MLYRAILLSSVLLTLSLTTGFSSSAIAQTDGDAKPVSQHVDTAAMYSISIEDLEMIMPDKRLQPEEESSADQPVESPFSHKSTQRRHQQTATITESDIESLESMETPAEASETPSR